MQRSLGHYELIAELGRGGMGVVYKAIDPRLERLVAIKCLSESFAEDERVVAGFFREARHVAAVNHPNVARIHIFDEHDGIPYLVMEYIDGDTLSARLKQVGALDPATALNITLHAAEALAAACEQKIIHCDVKPENIMLDRSDRVVLTDFGIAQVLSQSDERKGALVGTPGYIAPELCDGMKNDHRSDIFSLGMVLYEMLAGKAYFDDQPVQQMQQQMRQIGFPDLSALPAEAPAPLIAILKRMLNANPQLRYASYNELLAELRTLHDPQLAATAADGAATTTAPTGNVTDNATVLLTQSIEAGDRQSTSGTQIIRQPVMAGRPVWTGVAILIALLTTFAAIARLDPELFNEMKSFAGLAANNETAVTEPLAAIPEVEDPSVQDLTNQDGTDSTDDNSTEQPALEHQYDAVINDPEGSAPEETPDNSEALAMNGLPDGDALNKSLDATIPDSAPDDSHPSPADNSTATDKPIVHANNQNRQPSAERTTAAVTQPTGIVVLAVGDEQITTILQQTMENGLRSKGHRLINTDFIDGLQQHQFSGDFRLPAVRRVLLNAGARYLVLIRARPNGTQQLRYYGRQSTAYVTQLEVVTYDLVEKREVYSSGSSQLMYTALNAEAKAQGAVTPWLSAVSSQLYRARG